MRTKLKNLFTEIISGEWGEDDVEGKGVNVIRTANFENDGSINFKNITTRLILKKD